MLFDVFFTIFTFHRKELTHPGEGLGPDHQLRRRRPHPFKTVVANKVQRHCFFSSNIVQRYVYIIICIDILPAVLGFRWTAIAVRALRHIRVRVARGSYYFFAPSRRTPQPTNTVKVPYFRLISHEFATYIIILILLRYVYVYLPRAVYVYPLVCIMYYTKIIYIYIYYYYISY